MKITKFLALIVAMSIGGAAFGLDGRQVMQNAYDVKEPKFTRAQVKMILIEKNGAKEERIIDEWGKSENGLATIVMQFNSPASVKGTRFSQQENGGGKPDTKYIFLPEVGTVRPVAASQGTQSFMGSDATYDDMSTREVDDDTHELLAETEAKGKFTNCAKVKSTPKDPKSSQYQYRISWVDKETWVPVYVEMYNKKGVLCKILEVKNLKVIKGYPTPLENEMTNVETGHKTQLVMSEDRLKFDEPINPAYFSKGFLQNGKVSK